MNEDILFEKLEGMAFTCVVVDETEEEVKVMISCSEKPFEVAPLDGLRQMFMFAARHGLDNPIARSLMKSVDAQIAQIKDGGDDD